MDRSVGRILKTLEELGLADNTIVVFTSDHGDMAGSHGKLYKSAPYEESVRVPLLIRAPGMRRERRIVKGRVSHIDLAPTLMDLLGGPRHKLPGKSLMPLVPQGGPSREHVIVEKGAFRTPSCWRTVVSPDGWKLTIFPVGGGTLFNLEKDPLEKNDLYGKGEHKDVVGRLTARLRKWQESVDDPVPLKG